MQEHGLVSGWFTYQQKVLSGGRAKILATSIQIAAGGAPVFSGASLLDQTPVVLHAVYTAGAVKRGIPAGWAYQDAGMLRYELRDASWNPASPARALDLGGVYDEPQPNGGVTFDPDLGLKCLVSRVPSPSCPQGFDDIKGLLAVTKASFALVDYVRMVQPVYEAGSGGTQHARAAMDVVERVVRMPSCCCNDAGLTFTNRIRIGFALALSADRYLVQPNGSYRKVTTLKSVAISPTQEIRGAVPVKRSDLAALSGEIVSPVTKALVSVGDFPQIVNLAAVTYK
jgi:hypothetical protein